jgi:hypothetical protein
LLFLLYKMYRMGTGTKFLITKFLITEILITKVLNTKFLIDKVRTYVQFCTYITHIEQFFKHVHSR